MPPKHERSTFKSKPVTLLNCTPGNLDHAKGKKATIMTLANGDEIDNYVMNLNDTRRLAVLLLISLWTADDHFAGEVLQGRFPIDDDGGFYWPDLKPR